MSLENKALKNREIKELIDLSMEERVLCKYTAFLALEPWMKDSIFGEPEEEGEINTDINNNSQNTALIEISSYPNPASLSCNIKISYLPDLAKCEINVYDSKGNIVRILNNESATTGSELNLIWDLNDNYGNPVSSGIYYLIIRQGLNSYTHKISVVR